jgi:hypothetical protein
MEDALPRRRTGRGLQFSSGQLATASVELPPKIAVCSSAPWRAEEEEACLKHRQGFPPLRRNVNG